MRLRNLLYGFAEQAEEERQVLHKLLAGRR